MIDGLFSKVIEGIFEPFQKAGFFAETSAFSVDAMNSIKLLEMFDALNDFAEKNYLKIYVEEKVHGIDNLQKNNLRTLIVLSGEEGRRTNRRLAVDIDMSSEQNFERDLEKLKQRFLSEAIRLNPEIQMQNLALQPR
jgi:hypothetical protein